MKTYRSWLTTMLATLAGLLIVAAVIGKFDFVGPVYNTKLFKFDESIDTLIIGASQAASAMNTDHIDNSLSVAASGEPLFYTYYKAKALLANNPNIENVIVSISPIHIGPHSEKQLFNGSEASRGAVIKYYFLIDDVSDPIINKFSSDNVIGLLRYKLGVPFNYMSDLKVVLNYYRNNITYTDYDFFASDNSFDESHIEEERQKSKSESYFSDGNGGYPVSSVGIETVNRIANLSEEFDVKLTVVSTPVHAYFKSLIPDTVQVRFDKLMHDLQIKHTNLTFLDLSNLPIADENFLDGDHLNIHGAVEFSQYLSKNHLGE